MSYHNRMEDENLTGAEPTSDELDLELDLGGTEDVETLKQELAKKDDIIRQQNARLKEAKAKPRIKSEPYDEEIIKDVQYLKTLEQKRQYGYEQGLSPEETDFVFKFAGGTPTKEILENPFVKSGLEGFRASKRIENNTPGSSGASPVFGDKSFSDLSEEDRAKAFESRMKQIK